MSWTLSINGTTQTLEKWGLFSCALTLKSLAASTFECQSAPDAGDDTTPILPHGVAIALYQDDTCVFRGTSHDPKTSLKGHVRRWQYTAHDVWYDLDRTMAQQTWSVWSAVNNAQINTNLSRLTFGFTFDKTNIVSTEQMVSDLLAYASQYCGIAVGHAVTLRYTDNNLGVGQLYPVPWEAVDITITAAIRQVLKWHPTAVSWMDYSGDTPVLHITTADNAGYQTISGFETAQLAPRHDLQVPGYIVRFEGVTAVDGADKVSLVERSYPIGCTATTRGVVVHTVDWTGQTITPPLTIAQALYTETATLQQSGSIELHGSDCDVRDWIGRVSIDGLSLDGTAYVREVKYSLDQHRTSLSIGPQGNLGVSSMLDLLGRARAKSSTLSNQTSSDYSSGGMSGGKGDKADLSDEQEKALEQMTDVLANYEEQDHITVNKSGPIAIRILVRKETATTVTI